MDVDVPVYFLARRVYHHKGNEMNVPTWVKNLLPRSEIVSCSLNKEGNHAVVRVKVQYSSRTALMTVRKQTVILDKDKGVVGCQG